MTNYSRVRSTLTLVAFFIAFVVWAILNLQTSGARSYVETNVSLQNVESKNLANSSRLLAYAPPPLPFSGYEYQRTLTIDHNKVPNTDQSNFPVLISGTYSYLATVSNGGNIQNANGYDVIFTSDSGCTTKLNHEVETYNATTGAVNYWVKVPTVSHSNDTVIYLCYGNSSITADQSNRTEVWDSNYKGVWHLPNGSSLNANDSTSSANNGTIGGAVAGAAKIEGGGSFNGSSNYIDVKAGKVDTSSTTGTVSAWVKISALDTNGAVLGYGGSGTTAPAFWGVYTREVSGNRYFSVAGRASDGAQFSTVRGSTVLAANTWYYVTYSSNGSAWKIRLNGATAETLAAVLGTNTGQWIGDVTVATPDKSVIGAAYIGGGYSTFNWWHGLLDEVRLSNVERTDDWVQTEYNNQSSPATFYSISAATSAYPPTVSITSPTSGAIIQAPASVTITANAADQDGTVSKVEFFKDGVKIGEDTSSPFSFAWNNVPAGSYCLTAIATDNANATGTSSAGCVVVNATPTVSITSPAYNATLPAASTVTMDATANDSDGTVSKVEFFKDGVEIGEDTSSPFSFAWNNVPAGSYSLTAVATDNVNATTTSAAVPILVNAAPAVSIISPANNATFTGSTLTINATASDSDGGVSRVEFFRNDVEIGEDVSAPYSFAWANVPQGSSTLTAVATDGHGATTTSASILIQVVNFNLARLDPGNRTGGSEEDPLSRNFSWSLPIVSLPGRAGLNLGLSLSYNSLVWTRSGSYISFNDEGSFPSPGFRLGFPVIQPSYHNSEVGTNAFLVISPDGSRTELRQVGSSNLYEAGDSSFLQLDSSSMILRTTDGTQLSYAWQGNDYQCTQIKDRNGNFITINYSSGRIDTVVDTVNRTIKFNYDATNLLTSLTQTWTVSGASHTHTWAHFTYSDLSISTNFTGLTNLGPQNGASIKVLTRVKKSDDSHVDFDYTTWGQVWKISSNAADNHLLNYRSYNLPLNNTTAQTECPRFTERRDWAENWNRSGAAGASGLPAGPEQEVVTSFTVPSSSSWTMPDGTTQSGIVAQVTSADGTYNKIYFPAIRNTTSVGWHRGYASMVETYDVGNTRQRQSVTKWNQDNESLTYPVNPRVTETNVYDPAGNRKRITIDYGSYVQWNLPYLVKEYAADGTTEIRHTYTDYNLSQAYLDRRIIGLVSARRVSDTVIWQSIVYFSYDAGGSQLVGTPTATIQHDSAYGTNLTIGRGNVTAITRYDVFDINNPAKRSVSQMGYDINGSSVFSRDPSGHQNSIDYSDSFSADGASLDATRSFATFAYPTTLTDAEGYTSSVRYNYHFGAPTWKETPLPNTSVDTPGPQQRIIYDSIGRLQKVTQLSNGAYTRYVYSNSQNQLDIYATMIDGASEQNGNEAHSFQIVDGHGRVVANASAHPGSAGGFSGHLTLFDNMGRVIKSSNPTETNVNGSYLAWVATGDDVSSGWHYTQQTYDWKGRPRVTTNTDGTTKEASYSGCGCAGGEVVTLTDEGTLNGGVIKRRQQKIYSDILGRAVKTEVLNWEGGSVYSAKVNQYNARDQVTLTREFAGPEGSTTYQDTVITYDGHGRVKTRHLPQQQVDPNNAASTDHTTWVYNADDTVDTVTDARGAVSTFTHNDRHLATNITYSVPQGSSITVPAPVTHAYDAAGNRTTMTDGSGNVSYEYDQLSRLISETRQFAGLAGSYAMGYSYAAGGAVKSITDPTGATINYAFDPTGRTEAITGTAFGGVTQYASNMQYRAWGAIKGMSYGNQKTASVLYNSRLQPTDFDVSGVMAKSYQYENDGRLRFSSAWQENKFDRSYSYDHAGRVTEAFSGPLARGEADTNDRPYKMYYQYDALNHLVGRVGSRTWSMLALRLQGTHTFAHNRSNFFQYDADGRHLSGQGMNYTYDAAGRAITVVSNSGSKTQSHVYDGDGQQTKVVESVQETDDFGNTETIVTTRYTIRSTVLGGAMITELNELGQKTRSMVYGGGQVLAWQNAEGTPHVLWEYRDPSNASFRTVFSNGTIDESRQGEMDPLNTDAGARAPIMPRPQHTWPREDLTYPAFADLLSGNCTIDGIPAPCGMARQVVRSGAGEQCPNNECSRINRDNGRIEFFRSYNDGYSGYLEAGGRYLGDGLAESPSAGSVEEGELSNLILLHHSPQEPRLVGFENIWADLSDILKDEFCKSFIKDLIAHAQTVTGKKAHAFTVEGLLEELKKHPRNHPMGGVNGIGLLSTGAAGGAGGWDPETGLGFANIDNFPYVGSLRKAQRDLALILLHEIIHTATKARTSPLEAYGGYNDLELARAAFKYSGDPKDNIDDPANIPPGTKLGPNARGGIIWDRLLRKHCK